MAHQSIDMRCPGCGAPVSTDQTICNYCYRPIIISTFNSVNSMSLPEVNKYACSYRSALAKYGKDIVINCENNIAKQLQFLLDIIPVADNGNIEENMKAINTAISNINSLLRKRTELKRR